MKVAVVSSLLVALGLAPLTLVPAGYWQQQVGPSSSLQPATPQAPSAPNSSSPNSSSPNSSSPNSSSPNSSSPNSSPLNSSPLNTVPNSAPSAPALNTTAPQYPAQTPAAPNQVQQSYPNSNPYAAPIASSGPPHFPAAQSIPGGFGAPAMLPTAPFGSGGQAAGDPFAPNSMTPNTVPPGAVAPAMAPMGPYRTGTQSPNTMPPQAAGQPAIYQPYVYQNYSEPNASGFGQQRPQAATGFDAEDDRLTSDSQSLALRLRSAEEDQRSNMEAELKDLVTRQFEHRQELKRQEIAELETRLAEIRQRVEARESNKDQIIEQRVRDLTGDDPFRWDDARSTPNAESTNVVAGFYSDYRTVVAPQYYRVETPSRAPNRMSDPNEDRFDSTEILAVAGTRTNGRDLSTDERKAVELIGSEWNFVDGKLPEQLASSALLVGDLLGTNVRLSDQDCEGLTELVEKGLLPETRRPLQGEFFQELIDAWQAFHNRYHTSITELESRMAQIDQQMRLLVTVNDQQSETTEDLVLAHEELQAQRNDVESKLEALHVLGQDLQKVLTLLPRSAY